MTISPEILLTMRHVLDGVTEKIKTQFCVQQFVFENHAVNEIMSKNMVQPEGPR
jgi:hypothetical protein